MDPELKSVWLAFFNLVAGLVCLIAFSHSDPHVLGGVGFLVGALWLFPSAARASSRPVANSLPIVAAVLLLSAAILGFGNKG